MVVNRNELLETCKTCNGSGIGSGPPPGTIAFPGVLPGQTYPCSDCGGKG